MAETASPNAASAASSPKAVHKKKGGGVRSGGGRGVAKKGSKSCSVSDAQRKCGTYVAKLVQQECPGVSMSSRGLAVVCALLDLYEKRLAAQSILACHVAKKTTLGEEHIKGGATTVLPLELAHKQTAEAEKVLARLDKQSKSAKAAKEARAGRVGSVATEA